MPAEPLAANSAMDLLRFESRLTKALEAALAAGLLLMLGIILTLVAMRYVLQAGLIGANELATVIFVYLSSTGAAVAVGRGEHIRLDLLPRMLGRQGRRIAEIAALALVGTLNAVLVERSIVWIGTTGQTLMPATQAPRIVAQVAVPLGCALATLYCCTRIAAVLRDGDDR